MVAEPALEPMRDYYLVEDENGRRFWLYREGLYGRKRPRRAGSCTGCSRETKHMRLTPSSPSPPISPSCAAPRIRRRWWRTAEVLGLAAIGIADRNSFAGVVRAYR